MVYFTFRFFFHESSFLKHVDISAPDYDTAYSRLRSVIPSNYNVVRYKVF